MLNQKWVLGQLAAQIIKFVLDLSTVIVEGRKEKGNCKKIKMVWRSILFNGILSYLMQIYLLKLYLPAF
jgi:hypothetical protein